jgi:sugar phosphate isomerase/epimerase
MKKLSRRNFSRQLVIAAVMAPAAVRAMAAKTTDNDTTETVAQDKQVPLSRPGNAGLVRGADSGKIRLGGPVYPDEYQDPGQWIKALKSKGYSAAYCPVDENADDATVRAYREAADTSDIIIAEVGAWSNPISPDEAERKAALENCIRKLELADRIQARCCVNVSGSMAVGEGSYGLPHPGNLTKDTFDLIVETTRKIIDSVKPTRTCFTLEDMPAAYPDSVDSYLELIKAIDRPGFAAHLDPVNIVSSPTLYYHNGDMIRDAFNRLGKYIRSCHAKDTILLNDLTVHLSETIPGRGNLDYAVYLRELARLDNVPLMMEHIEREEYPEAARFIRKTGESIGVGFY